MSAADNQSLGTRSHRRCDRTVSAGTPRYRKWSRRSGARKKCPACQVLWPIQRREGGKTHYVKRCPDCATALPSENVFPPRSKRKWYVRVTQPDGRVNDHRCESSEQADLWMREHARRWTADPVRRELIDHINGLAHGIEADDLDKAKDELIDRLGGDPASRSLKPVTWDQAVSAILDQMGDMQLSEGHRQDTLRAIRNFAAITRRSRWCDVDHDDVLTFQSARLKGGWTLEQPGKEGQKSKVIRSKVDSSPTLDLRPDDLRLSRQAAVGPRGVNKDVAMLRAFCKRAIKRGFLVTNPFDGMESLKERRIRPEYIPDQDLKAIMAAARESEHPWMEAMLVTKIFTGCRNQDIIAFQWDRDVDLDGLRIIPDGLDRPKIYVSGEKADTGHWIPMHGDLIVVLKAWRGHQSQKLLIDPDRKLYPMPGSKVSTQKRFLCDAYRDLCLSIGLWKWRDMPSGRRQKVCKWSLHDFRRLMNTNLRNSGLSPKERAELIGQRSVAVNQKYYEALDAGRAAAAIDSLPSLAG